MSLKHRLDDGFSTRITFDSYPNVEFWEKGVKLPGIDGWTPIETTTMRNTLYRTFSPRALITLSVMHLTVAFSSDFYNTGSTGILPMTNKNTQITATLPDGATYTFWGFVQGSEPSEMVEGSQPTQTITIHPSNQDNNKVEQAPTFVASSL